MTSEKAYDVEQRLNDMLDGGFLSPYLAQRDSDLGRGGQTLTDDPQLTLTVPTPGTYLLDASILYKGGTGVSAGHLNFSWNTGGVGTLRSVATRLRTATTDWWQEKMNAADTNISKTDGLSTEYGLRITGSWTVTANSPVSTLTFQWCKNAAADGTTNTSVLQYSHISLRRAIGPLA